MTLAPKILVVDDDPLNQKLIRVLLLAEGFAVATASDVFEGLRALDVERPALVLLDLQLPGISGLELARWIRSRPDLGAVRVLAVSAFAMKGDAEKALAAGCDDYLTKPIETRTFGATVRRWLESNACGPEGDIS